MSSLNDSQHVKGEYLIRFLQNSLKLLPPAVKNWDYISGELYTKPEDFLNFSKVTVR